MYFWTFKLVCFAVALATDTAIKLVLTMEHLNSQEEQGNPGLELWIEH